MNSISYPYRKNWRFWIHYRYYHRSWPWAFYKSTHYAPSEDKLFTIQRNILGEMNVLRLFIAIKKQRPLQKRTKPPALKHKTMPRCAKRLRD